MAASIGYVDDQLVTISEIRFRTGERTKFQTHDYGQTLYVTAGGRDRQQQRDRTRCHRG